MLRRYFSNHGHKGRVAVLLSDVALWTVAGWFAFLLRLDADLVYYVPAAALYTALGLPIKLGAIWFGKLHQQSWRDVGVPDLTALVKSLGIGTVFLLAVAFAVNPHALVPRSVPFIEASIALLLLGGARLLSRLIHERQQGDSTLRQRRVLIVGAGGTGTLTARDLKNHPETGLVPIGFLDDDPAKRHKSYLGLPVFGTLEALPEVVNMQGADEVIVAMPSAAGEVVRRVLDLAKAAGVSCRSVPSLQDILSGKQALSDIRDINAEDLLGRVAVELDLDTISQYLENRVVLVTGAGGSIGAELVRQIARFNPRQVLLWGRGENSIYTLEQELRRTWPELDYRTLIGDVRDANKLAYIFERYRPQVVFHAAAHKHVPLMEQHPDEAILNNIQGTRNLVELALQYKVACLVNISTDKAVNPTSVMGTTKRIAEYLVADAASRADDQQVFVSVRFGNVLGSRGSVIPLFKAQIRAGGPVTVTHPEMIRYFMTIPEAAQLVLQAGGLGENGQVYVLDMGEPVKIADLARDVIRLSGLELGKDISIVYTGTRPGEKLFEELLTAEEGTVASRYEKIFVAKVDIPDHDSLAQQVDNLIKVAASYDKVKIQEGLHQLVPQYHDPS